MQVFTFFAFCMLSFGSMVQAQTALSAEQVQQVKSIVADYLDQHPEAVTQSLQKAQTKETERLKQKALDYLNAHQTDLADLIKPYAQGPQKSTVTVVAFLDYQCGHCKAMYHTLDHFKTSVPITKAYVQLPILGPQSIKASTLALSAENPEVFSEINRALFAVEGEYSDAILKQIGKKYHITMRTDEALEALLRRNFTWAMHLGIQGSPSIIVSNGRDSSLFYGRISEEQLEESIQALASQAALEASSASAAVQAKG